MGELHQHPDGLVYIRFGILGVHDLYYVDTPSNLALDCPDCPLPILPEDANERIYTQGKRHAIMGGGNIIDGGPLPWEIGDYLIDHVADILIAQDKRIKAKEKELKNIEEARPKTPEELRNIALTRIFDRYTLAEQLRMHTRAIRLLLKMNKNGKLLSETELAELREIETAWDWIDSQ